MGVLETFNRAVERQRARYKANNPCIVADNKWLVFSELQARKLVKKYPNDFELWERFWQHMSDQSDLDAPFEYVFGCCEVLEKVWEEKRSEKNGQ